VEGVHFDRVYTPAKSLGWKALAISLSDVAAMGGIPRHAVLSVALTEAWTVEDVEAFYRGMNRCGETYGCDIIGGDTVRSGGSAFFSVTVIGEVEETRLVRRDGARQGDLLCITGELGSAKVGLEVLMSGSDSAVFSKSVSRFLEPEVRVREARALVESLRITSMIDISDGLASEIGHLCRKNGLGCSVLEEKIPVAGEVVAWAGMKKRSPASYALTSGEEYELLFTVSEAEYHQWSHHAKTFPFPISILGVLTSKEEGMQIQRGAEHASLLADGWDHFSD
jgi:thiamine-monophosphate kinase